MKTSKQIIKDIKKWYSRRNRLERTMLWSLTAIFFISCIFSAGVQAWNGYHGLNINQEECVNIGVETALLYSNSSTRMIIFVSLLPIIKFLLIAIGISWIIHGFQVRILA